MRALRGGQAACGKRGGRRASMVSLLIGLCVFASRICVCRLGQQIGATRSACSPTSSEQLPQYVAAAGNAPAFDKGSVADYSDAILSWWR